MELTDAELIEAIIESTCINTVDLFGEVAIAMMVSNPAFTILRTGTATALILFPDRSFHVFWICDVDEAYDRLWTSAHPFFSTQHDKYEAAVAIQPHRLGDPALLDPLGSHNGAPLLSQALRPSSSLSRNGEPLLLLQDASSTNGEPLLSQDKFSSSSFSRNGEPLRLLQDAPTLSLTSRNGEKFSSSERYSREQLQHSGEQLSSVAPQPSTTSHQSLSSSDAEFDALLEAQRVADLAIPVAGPTNRPRRKREVLSDHDYRLRKERTETLFVRY
jgi:hypothetical protein